MGDVRAGLVVVIFARRRGGVLSLVVVSCCCFVCWACCGRVCCLSCLVDVALPEIQKELGRTFKYEKGFAQRGTVRGVLGLPFEYFNVLCVSFLSQILWDAGVATLFPIVACSDCHFNVLCLLDFVGRVGRR